MKKLVFMMMAVCAVAFTSCGNKAQQSAPADEVVVDEAIDVQQAVSEATAQLSEQIEAGDASKLQAVLETIKTKVTELIKTNPEVAKEYVEKVQDFLKENADKVKALVGDNAAVAAAVSAITDIEPESVVSGFLQSVGDAATEAKDAAVDAVNEQVDAAKDAAEQKAEEVKDAAKKQASDAIDGAADNTKKALGL
jgi:hypothetical protein